MKAHYNCSQCPMAEKICRSKNGKGPKGCPTKTEKKILASAMKEYRDPGVMEFAGWLLSRRVPVMPFGRTNLCVNSTKTRVDELIEFSRRMKYKRLGMAFCAGLAREAAILSTILESHGFDVVAVTCKVGGVPKEAIKSKKEKKSGSVNLIHV